MGAGARLSVDCENLCICCSQRAPGGRGLHSSTSQLNLSRFGHTSRVLLSTRLGKLRHPTYLTRCVHVEPISGRV